MEKETMNLIELWKTSPKHKLVLPYRELAEYEGSHIDLAYARDGTCSEWGFPLREERDKGLVFTLATLEKGKLLNSKMVPLEDFMSEEELQDSEYMGYESPIVIRSDDIKHKTSEYFLQAIKKDKGSKQVSEGNFTPYALPFIFTDYEPKSANLREIYRNLNSAKLLEKMVYESCETPLIDIVAKRPKNKKFGTGTKAMDYSNLLVEYLKSN